MDLEREGIQVEVQVEDQDLEGWIDCRAEPETIRISQSVSVWVGWREKAFKLRFKFRAGPETIRISISEGQLGTVTG